MKTLKIATLLAATALLLAVANNSLAGTMTPAASPSPQPSFNPSGVVSANTIALQQTSPSILKILGNATITPGAGASSVTLTLSGTFTANAGDLASYAYNFNLTLNSATPASFTLSLAAGPLSTATGVQTIPADSTLHTYTGKGSTSSAPIGASGNFTAQLKIDFAAGTTASDTLQLAIPANSIDFAVQPVAIPEPSTYALIAVGLVGLLVWRRRQPVTASA
jgi:hypothetical protein